MNVVGTDFEKYNDLKPNHEIKLKILNLFMEYNESADKKHAADEFKDIIEKTGVQKFIFVGQILKNAFSHDETGWNSILSLVVDHFYLKEKLFEGKDLMEAVNVSMVNFCDMVIDYPNSKDYAFGMFDRLCELELLASDMLEKYKLHVINLESMGYDYE